MLHDFAGWPKGPLFVAIGVFDGVHVGHQALVRGLVERARAARGTALACTFDPPPIEVLAPGAPPSRLSEIDERALLLEGLGATSVVFHCTTEFLDLPPEEFARRLKDAGDIREVCVGEDFQFGKDRGGNVDTLRRLGFPVNVAAPITVDGRIVSSTRIRNALIAGDVDDAARLLGRPYRVTGSVVHGDQRGRALGFPTVNLAVAQHRLLPRDGIYAMWCEVEGRRVPAAASLGVRPTFGGGERRLEAFLLDWTGDVYGERVAADFVKRLRDELRFASAAELAEQIAKDVAETRKALNAR